MHRHSVLTPPPSVEEQEECFTTGQIVAWLLGGGGWGGFSVLGLVKGKFMGHSKECFSDPL